MLKKFVSITKNVAMILWNTLSFFAYISLHTNLNIQSIQGLLNKVKTGRPKSKFSNTLKYYHITRYSLVTLLREIA